MVRRFPRGAAPSRPRPRPASDQRRDGVERRIGAGAVGPSGLGEIGAASAALAAKRLGAGAGKLDRVVGSGEIVGDADHEAGLALLRHADDGDDARAQAGAWRRRRARADPSPPRPERAGEQLDRAEIADGGRGCRLQPRRRAQARAWRRRAASRASAAHRGWRRAARSSRRGRPSAVPPPRARAHPAWRDKSARPRPSAPRCGARRRRPRFRRRS